MRQDENVDPPAAGASVSLKGANLGFCPFKLTFGTGVKVRGILRFCPLEITNLLRMRQIQFQAFCAFQSQAFRALPVPSEGQIEKCPFGRHNLLRVCVRM